MLIFVWFRIYQIRHQLKVVYIVLFWNSRVQFEKQTRLLNQFIWPLPKVSPLMNVLWILLWMQHPLQNWEKNFSGLKEWEKWSGINSKYFSWKNTSETFEEGGRMGFRGMWKKNGVHYCQSWRKYRRIIQYLYFEVVVIIHQDRDVNRRSVQQP